MSTKQQTVRNFAMHAIEDAPEASRPAMQWYLDGLGMVPNLARVMSGSPSLLLSYWQTQLNLLEKGGLSKQEVNIVETVVAHQNQCQYCVAGHTAFGKDPLFNNTDEQMNAIRENKDFEDAKLNALRAFTLQTLEAAGRVTDTQLEAFLTAGYSRSQALDVVACIAAKVMSNFTNQIALTPIDEPFAPLAEGLPYQEERKSIAA